MSIQELENEEDGIIKPMKQPDYHTERVKLQKFQAKLHMLQVVIQFLTFLSTLILLAKKL
jgi:hypothetical protein